MARPQTNRVARMSLVPPLVCPRARWKYGERTAPRTEISTPPVVFFELENTQKCVGEKPLGWAYVAHMWRVASSWHTHDATRLSAVGGARRSAVHGGRWFMAAAAAVRGWWTAGRRRGGGFVVELCLYF